MAEGEGYTLITRDATTGDRTVQLSADGVTWTTSETTSGTASTVTNQAPTAITFAATWSNYGGGWTNGSYSKQGNVVQLGGMIKTSAYSAGMLITTLPAGFRPAAIRSFASIANGALAWIDVRANGEVALRAGTGATTWLSLDGISYYAEA